MSNEQSIRDEIAEAMIGVQSADGREWFIFGDTEDDRADTLVLADAIMPLVRRIQAEALREASDLMLDPEEGLPFDDDEDRAIPSAWLLEQSARIEGRQHD